MRMIFVYAAILLSLSGYGQHWLENETRDHVPADRPRLVVGIVIDQMRWDYLYKYYTLYGAGGFKRMLSEGYSCDNTLINYLPSVTAVGHSSIYTGSVPALSGITDNYWVETLTGKGSYCTDDSTVHGVGANSAAGKMSPRNLLVSTIGDELRMATHYQSKVVGVALKDRGSILPAGHTATAAFWFDDASGNFITSSYYMDSLPEWVDQFNRARLAGKLVSKDWTTLYPPASYVTSDSDNQEYEAKFEGEHSPVFPHRTAEMYRHDQGSFRSTPFGNTFTFEFAKKAVEGYHLGKGKMTDLLAISCSSTDYVGHRFGPNSMEIEDTYLRLDRDLASFFSYLDEKVGKGRYTVFLSADHGVAHNTGYLLKNRLPAGLLKIQPVTDTLNHLLTEKFGVSGLVREIGDQVMFDMPAILHQHLDLDTIKAMTINYLQRQDGIAYVADLTRINELSIPEPLKTMMVNGYYCKRKSPIAVIYSPGWIGGDAIGPGTGHGTLYPFDTHIPLLFMGWGIRRGSSHAEVHITDIAPTISALLHIQMPNGCIGQPIESALK